eukprot:1533036-Prymnesium_polylepis.1
MLHSLGVHEVTPEVLAHELRERQLDHAHDVPGTPPDAATAATGIPWRVSGVDVPSALMGGRHRSSAVGCRLWARRLASP